MDEKQLSQALKQQARLRDSGVLVRLGQVLIQRDLISSSQLVGLLAEQRGARGDDA